MYKHIRTAVLRQSPNMYMYMYCVSLLWLCLWFGGLSALGTEFKGAGLGLCSQSVENLACVCERP